MDDDFVFLLILPLILCGIVSLCSIPSKQADSSCQEGRVYFSETDQCIVQIKYDQNELGI